MKQLFIASLLILLTIGFFSCKHKKQSDTIITKITSHPKKNKTPQKQAILNYKKEITWLEEKYTILIQRHPDTTLPVVKDDNGNTYYENQISLVIKRKDGTNFYSHIFTKTDFRPYVGKRYYDKGVLIGFMFDKIQGNELLFGVCIGSPDPTSDLSIPIDVRIDNTGKLIMKTSIDVNIDEENTDSII